MHVDVSAGPLDVPPFIQSDGGSSAYPGPGVDGGGAKIGSSVADVPGAVCVLADSEDLV